MTNRTVSAFIILFLLGISSPLAAEAFWQSPNQDMPLLTIGDEPIDKDELIYLISKGNNSDSGTAGMSREEFDENLDLFINYKLKVKEAESLGLDQTPEFKREFESFQENLKSPFLIRNSLEEGELRKAYARMQEVIHASHILLKFPPNASKDDSVTVLRMALKLKEEINNGADINELALEYSEDPSAQANKGDLGYFTALQMVQPFEDAAFSLQPGQVSDPVLTDFGYHIIKVQDRQPNPGQVRVSHILVRINEDLPNGEDQAKRKVADIYTEIQKESTIWEDIVKTYSEDPSTSQKGGMLPWFSVGSMIPEFEMAAFSLTEIGEVSPPIQTRYGYHILRLESKKPLDSFESMEESIRSRILRDSRSTMIQSQVMAIQKSRYGFEENEAVVQDLESKLNDITQNQLLEELKAGESSNLFTLQGKPYSTSDLANFIAEKELIMNTQHGIFSAWYERFAADVLNEVEEADLAANNKEYRMLLKEYRDGILLFSLMNDQVWQKGLNDSIGQLKYYQDHIENYQWKDRVNALIVKVLDLKQLETAKNALQGKSLSDGLISSFDSDVISSNPSAYQEEHGLIEYQTHPVLAQADLNKNLQEIEANGHLHLVLLGDQVPAGPRKFEESRGMVIRDYQEYLNEALIDRLKKKYPININPKAKEETFVALNQ
ncbi:peptidylprolyl isomerase [Algoriphagus halophytocola]|uniref:Peptidylprolyl isomerase n=1 Tax=Algoriphagus halophytocola TaxID=2991499 RepID=A0ABY6MDS2_9BACT|nr:MULTISPECIES: peptidylprolyl isomerase [unclassified Algoriphagus]UZD21920.1 peptidylprolyl isomerase [Algoriphagus sp. TR-M5]WBL43171.1 peptidylprolyl isomerase [Algoriphagus sp. TR-M9]